MFFVVDEIKMSVEHASYRVSDDYGYVGHSFNQYIQSDGEYIYRLDHGDAYPRKMVLTKTKIEEIEKVMLRRFPCWILQDKRGTIVRGLLPGDWNIHRWGVLRPEIQLFRMGIIQQQTPAIFT